MAGYSRRRPPKVLLIPADIHFVVASIVTQAARRHIRRMLAAIAPVRRRLDREFARLLRERPYDADQIAAFRAVTPAAACGVPLSGFLKAVDSNGRRLAKLNIPPQEAEDVLREFGSLLQAALGDRFQPAREQLELATILAIRQAYFGVRETESQAFFEMHDSGHPGENLEDRLRRVVRILARTFHAQSGTLVLGAASPQSGRPRYSETGRNTCCWSYALPELGVMQFAFASRRRWLPRELSLLESAAQHCKEAWEQDHLAAEVRRLEAERRRVEEEERRRIGRELHDEAGQSLLFLRLQLEMMEREAPPEWKARLSEAREITAATITELRRIIAALSPAVLERLGLERALHQLAARFRKAERAGLRMSVGRCQGMPPDTQEVIYRVAQEALQNVAKHAHARRVNLRLKTADEWIRLSVSDDGAGFCAETANGKPMSFGLAGMRERAALMGGKLALRSAPGKGTLVILQLPRDSAWEALNGKDSHLSH